MGEAMQSTTSKTSRTTGWTRKTIAIAAAGGLFAAGTALASAPAYASGSPTGTISGSVSIGSVTTLSLESTSFTLNTTPGQTSVTPQDTATVASNDGNGWTATEALTGGTFTGPSVLGTAQTIPDPQWAVQNYKPFSGTGDDYTLTWENFDAAGDAQTILTVPAGETPPGAFYTNWPDSTPGAPGQDNTTGSPTYGDILFGIFNQLAVPGSQDAGTYTGTFTVVVIPA